MAIFKMQWVFNQGRNGWTESHYITAPSMDVARTVALNLAIFRQQLCGKGVVLEGMRLGDPLVRGSTLIERVPTLASPVQEVADAPWSSGIFSLRYGTGGTGAAANTYRRNYLMRGLPWICFDGSEERQNVKINGAYQKTFADLFDALKNAGAALKANTKNTAAAVIEDAETGVGGGLTFTTQANHGFAVRDTVLLAGLKYTWKPSNGRAIVIDLPATDKFTIGLKPGQFVPSGLFFAPAFVQRVIFFNPTLRGWTFLRQVKKATGASFFSTVGKYKTRSTRY
jgi:hypothetical protein